jgi:hypothetical protein
MKLLDFVELFAMRRREFEFELTLHTSKGVDKAIVNLEAIRVELKEQSVYLQYSFVFAMR